MIQPLRRRHLGIWIFLSVLLVILFAAGIQSRRTTVTNNLNLHWDSYK